MTFKETGCFWNIKTSNTTVTWGTIGNDEPDQTNAYQLTWIINPNEQVIDDYLIPDEELPNYKDLYHQNCSCNYYYDLLGLKRSEK